MSTPRQPRRLAFAALLLCAATAGALSPYGIKRTAAPDEVVEFFLTGDLLVAAFADRTIVSYDAATGRVVGQFSLPGTARPGPLRLHLLDGPAPAIIWLGRSGEPDAPERHLIFDLPTGARRPFNPPWERHADVLPANAGRYVLKVADGRGRVESGGRGELALDVRGLAALYSGFLAPSELVRCGLATGSAAALEAAATLFTGPHPWMRDGF